MLSVRVARRPLVAAVRPATNLRTFHSHTTPSNQDNYATSSASTASSTPSTARAAKRPSMKESSTEAAQRAFALKLYKAILRAHRTVLPEAMRSLGDAYVREEFKLHKSAKPQHLHGFFTAWIQCQSQRHHGKSLIFDIGYNFELGISCDHLIDALMKQPHVFFF